MLLISLKLTLLIWSLKLRVTKPTEFTSLISAVNFKESIVSLAMITSGFFSMISIIMVSL